VGTPGPFSFYESAAMGIEIASFILFAAAMVGTPGPANMLILAASASFGFWRALPFIAGVVLGMQFVIWPMGLGLMALTQRFPLGFDTLKWVSVAYIFWLAYKILGARLYAGVVQAPPSFLSGLAVHPLNPKAWAMTIAAFTSFVSPGTAPLKATLAIALGFFAVQSVLQPLWGYGGQFIAARLAGRPAEKTLMWGLAGLTLASVLFVLVKGD